MKADETAVRRILERAIAEFQSNPLSSKTMRRFATDAPGIFAPVGINMLLTASNTAGSRYLAILLAKQPTLFKKLADPDLFTRAQAVTLSRRLMTVDPLIDMRLARQLPGRNGALDDTIDGAKAERALDVLDEISQGKRIVPVLSHLTRHHDHKISSKATLLIGKRVENVAFAKRVIQEETDGRTRANAIEAVWGNDSPPVQELFWECVEDRHNRVVGNAIVGLYLAGEEKVSGVVTRFAQDYKAEFRMTSAWTMGRIGDSEYLPSLTPLIRDQHPGVRGAALRSLQHIRQVEKMRRPSETNLEEELPETEEQNATVAEVPEVNVELRLDGSQYSLDRSKRLCKASAW